MCLARWMYAERSTKCFRRVSRVDPDNLECVMSVTRPNCELLNSTIVLKKKKLYVLSQLNQEIKSGTHPPFSFLRSMVRVSTDRLF